MNKKVVGFDIDGCLADFEGMFCETFGFEHREMVDITKRYPKYKREILEFVDNPYTYKVLAPIQLGLDICQWLYDNGFEVAIVSSRPHGTQIISIDWLKKHGVKFTSISVTPLIPKTIRLQKIDPLLHVDDMWGVARDLSKVYIESILIAQAWNEKRLIEFPRVKTLDEFVNAFKIIYDWRTR